MTTATGCRLAATAGKARTPFTCAVDDVHQPLEQDSRTGLRPARLWESGPWVNVSSEDSQEHGEQKCLFRNQVKFRIGPGEYIERGPRGGQVPDPRQGHHRRGRQAVAAHPGTGANLGTRTPAALLKQTSLPRDGTAPRVTPDPFPAGPVWCNKAAEVGESAKQGRCEWLLPQ